MSGKAHGGKGKSGAKDSGSLRSQSSSARAGLQFPVGRIKRYLHELFLTLCYVIFTCGYSAKLNLTIFFPTEV